MFHQVSQEKNPDLEGGLMGLGTNIIRMCNITFTCGTSHSHVEGKAVKSKEKETIGMSTSVRRNHESNRGVANDDY